MNNQQIYSLCGVITLSAGVIANSLILLIYAFFCFIFAIREAE